MKSTHLPKLLGITLDPRSSHNESLRISANRCMKRLAQLKVAANNKYGPLPRDHRQFVLGYGVSQLSYGTEVTWATADDAAKDRVRQVHAKLARTITGLVSNTDAESALLEANMLPLHITCCVKRTDLFERLWSLDMDWSRRPDPEPPPRRNFRISPVSSCEWKHFLTGILREAGAIDADEAFTSIPREGLLKCSSIQPWQVNNAHLITIGMDTLPETPNHEPTAQQKRSFSLKALQKLPSFGITVCTDGGSAILEGKSVAVALRVTNCFSTEVIAHQSENCGNLACSYRAESRAMLLALERIIKPLILHGEENEEQALQNKSVLLITDSLSLLQALSTGPLTQTNMTEDSIMRHLMLMTNLNWSFHLQFVYAHCGIAVNELADSYATACMNDLQFTVPEPAPLWHTDMLSCVQRVLRTRWLAKIRRDTHRYELLRTKASDLSGKDLLTGELLSREDLTELARARCGVSTTFGRLYWGILHCENTCRFCNLSRSQAAQLYKPNVEEGTSTTDEPTEHVQQTRHRRREQCPHCNSTYSGYSALKSHCATKHADLPPPPPNCLCQHCGSPWPTRRSCAQHSIRCPSNPDSIRTHVSGKRRRDITPRAEKSQTTAPPGAQETLAHWLWSCPHPFVQECRPTLDRQNPTFLFNFLHSKQLLNFIDELTRRAPPL